MSPEIDAEMLREVVALGGHSETSEYSVDSAVTAGDREAASGTWAIGDPFADDGFHDDGNSIFPAEDPGPARDGTPSSEGHPHLRRLSGLRRYVRSVIMKGNASRGGQPMNARNDDGSPEIR
jgi:hypothetical protein